ncbi:MAG: DsrE family protein [Spirochaetia bacterium]
MNEDLYVLWTTDNPDTAEHMVFMYTHNGLKKGWWKQVTLIIWGASAKLAAENSRIQMRLKEMMDDGVTVSACRACAERLGAAEALEKLGIEVKYWGQPLTEILKTGKTLLSV